MRKKLRAKNQISKRKREEDRERLAIKTVFGKKIPYKKRESQSRKEAPDMSRGRRYRHEGDKLGGSPLKQDKYTSKYRRERIIRRGEGPKGKGGQGERIQLTGRGQEMGYYCRKKKRPTGGSSPSESEGRTDTPYQTEKKDERNL